MKFVLIGPAPPFRGGISQYNASLGAALAKDHQVLLISFSRQYPAFIFPGRSQHAEGNGHGPSGPLDLAAERLLDSVNPVSWAKVVERIGGFAPDAAIFQWWHPFFAPAYWSLAGGLRKRTRARVFFLCHNVYPHERLPFPGGRLVQDWLIRLAFARVDGFLVHSGRLGEQVRRFNRRAALRQIYHPRYDFYSEWDSQAASPSPCAQLLFFGKIREYKGLDVFLEALARIGPKLKFRATVAGEFYVDDRPYRRLAERLGLQDRLVWIDRYVENERVPQLFREADLVVLPYREASQSGVVPLAYEFEVPVVASDVGGLAEVVLHGQTGFLVPPEDAEALADRIVAYFAEGRKAEFQANIRSFRRNLSWGQVVDSILSLLDAGE